MVLQRWDPMSDLRRMEETMNRLWKGFGNGGLSGDGVEGWFVPLDVIDEGDTILVKASLPGVDPKDVSITIEEGVLTIKGRTHEDREEPGEDRYLMRERRLGSFHRSLRLPDTVDADKAGSSYEHGVLEISFPKQEAKKAKKIEIKVTT